MISAAITSALCHSRFDWTKQFICAKITIKQITHRNERTKLAKLIEHERERERGKNTKNTKLNVVVAVAIFFSLLYFNVQIWWRREMDIKNNKREKQTNDKMDCSVAARQAHFQCVFFLLLFGLFPFVSLFWLNSYWLLFCMCWPTWNVVRVAGMAGGPTGWMASPCVGCCCCCFVCAK